MRSVILAGYCVAFVIHSLIILYPRLFCSTDMIPKFRLIYGRAQSQQFPSQNNDSRKLHSERRNVGIRRRRMHQNCFYRKNVYFISSVNPAKLFAQLDSLLVSVKRSTSYSNLKTYLIVWAESRHIHRHISLIIQIISSSCSSSFLLNSMPQTVVLRGKVSASRP